MADDDEFFRPEDELSRYATYGGGAVVHSAAQATAAAAATAQTTTTGHLSSLMLAASDDLEIPLINNEINLHHNGGPGRGGRGVDGVGSDRNCCLLGQKGFRQVHSEHASNKRAKQQLIVATLICFLFMIAELIGGLMAGSLAVVTDAAHLLTDCIGFIVAMVAISFAKRLPDRRMTFGYKRFEILGAVVSVLGIWLLTGILVYLATLRLIDTSFEIDADTMIIISTIGVGINIVMASVLHGNCLKVPLPHGHSHSGTGHGHSHSHSHNGRSSCKSAQISTTSNACSSGVTLPKKDDVLLTHGVINMHSTSIHTTHSRHNSFSKTLPNGTNLLSLDTSEIISGVGGAPTATTTGHSIVGVGDKASSRINLDHHNHHNHTHHHPRHNGSYTLLSVGSNEDQLNDNDAGCDSDDQEHHCLDHEDDDSADDDMFNGGGGGGDSDLKLNGGTGASSGGGKSGISSNINIRAAMIHVIGDFVQSVGVLISAIVIKFYPDAKLIDPICTFVFSVIVFFTTIRIMKEALVVLLDAVPRSINLARLEKDLRSVDGVRSVHHLTVFGVSVDWNVMSAHLVIDNMTSGEEVIRTVAKLVKRTYNIKHVTVQIERQKTSLLALQQQQQLNSRTIGGNELI